MALIFKRFLFFCLAFLLLGIPLLLVSEWVARRFVPPLEVVRQVHPHYVLDLRCGIYLPPNLQFDEFGKQMRINSLGFRGPEVPPEKEGLRFAL